MGVRAATAISNGIRAPLLLSLDLDVSRSEKSGLPRLQMCEELARLSESSLEASHGSLECR